MLILIQILAFFFEYLILHLLDKNKNLKKIMSCLIISLMHLKWIIQKLDRSLWIGFIWLKKGTNDSPL
jgi:hypothetical protein